MEIHELSAKELKIIVLKFIGLQGNTDIQFNKIKKIIQEQNEEFMK